MQAFSKIFILLLVINFQFIINDCMAQSQKQLVKNGDKLVEE